MNIDAMWTNTIIAEKLLKIIESESIKLIPITKISPFEAHFGRPWNTEFSNLLTKSTSDSLSNIKKNHSS